MNKLGKQPSLRLIALFLTACLLEGFYQPLQRTITILHEYSHALAVYLSNGYVFDVTTVGCQGQIVYQTEWPNFVLFLGYAGPIAVFGFLYGLPFDSRWLHFSFGTLFFCGLYDAFTDFAVFPFATSDFVGLTQSTGTPGTVWMLLYTGIGLTVYRLGRLLHQRGGVQSSAKPQRQCNNDN